ncbi:hypothetical protein D3C80_1564650 [compost metagenome]
MGAMIVPGFQPEPRPVARATLHIEVAYHHVIGSVQEDQRSLIGRNRRREVHVAPLDLIAATGPLKANIQPAVVMNGEHFVDRIDLGSHVVVEGANAV